MSLHVAVKMYINYSFYRAMQ